MSAAEHHMLATAHGKMFNSIEAIKHFRIAVEKNPGKSAWFNDLGSALYTESKDLVAAETAYKQALQINPNSQKAYNNIGALL